MSKQTLVWEPNSETAQTVGWLIYDGNEHILYGVPTRSPLLDVISPWSTYDEAYAWLKSSAASGLEKGWVLQITKADSFTRREVQTVEIDI